MTTDITELAQSLKAAAEKASNGDWVKESGDGWEACCSANDQANGGFIIAHFVGPDAAENREFVQAANPANVLALVEALEYYKSREERVTSLVRDNSKSWDELYRQVEAKGKRNVELVVALESEKRICATWRKTAKSTGEKLEKAQTINAAAEKLVRCKGRYHSEQNYRALAALFGVNTPDLPPLEHENVHYGDTAEMEIETLRQRIAELEREQEHLRPVGVMSEQAFHRLENRECRFIALWPRPGIFLPRKRPEDGVIVYARTAAAAGIKVEAD